MIESSKIKRLLDRKQSGNQTARYKQHVPVHFSLRKIEKAFKVNMKVGKTNSIMNECNVKQNVIVTNKTTMKGAINRWRSNE
ncbi:hypothetical protein F6Y02_39395 (plasmid) [Bacillus megaterium]|nr:hypothetical protein [Priestia megaterium]